MADDNKNIIIEPNQAPNDQDSNKGEQVQQDQTLDSSSGAPKDRPPKRLFLLKWISGFKNLYFAIFIGLLLMAAGGVYLSIKLSNSTSSKTPQSQSLTNQQISQLKGNTTLVGNSQQTLDIQGNSIFEGSVLLRNSLDVAGSIKVGGTLSLPAITVGGSSSFGQIQVSQTLLVGGNTTLQGQLTLQKGLTVAGAASFGTLSASQLNASALQLSGDFVVNRHINVSGGLPSSSGGAALGSGGTASINGTDTAGTVTINTGGAPVAGCFVTLNFTQHFNATPHVVISPSNSSAGSIDYYTNRSSTNFSICDASTPSSSTTYVFDYIIVD